MSRVVIVGASKGIGRDVQPYLRAAGHDVAVLPRNPEAYPGMQMPCDALFLCQRYRGEDEWNGELEVSLSKTKRMCEWAGQYMHGGSIVVMSSVAASSVEDEQPASYHVGKAGMEAMVRYYAKTLGPKGVRVNAIVPGVTIKPEARAFYDAHPELEATYTRITPLGRMCSVEDIANLVDFLISGKSSYMTGQTLTLDGGIGLASQWNAVRRVTPSVKELQVTQRLIKAAGKLIAEVSDERSGEIPSPSKVH